LLALKFQTKLYKAADSFWPSWLIVLLAGPGVETSKRVGLKPYANKRAYPGRSRAPLFLCYQGLLFHINRDNRIAGREEARTSSTGPNPMQWSNPMHKAAITNIRPAKFNELAFYDNVTAALRGARGIIECAWGIANDIDQEPLGDALGVSVEKLQTVTHLLGEWEADRIARTKAEQVKVAAAKAIYGVGEPVPLTRETRRRIQNLLDQSIELKPPPKRGRGKKAKTRRGEGQ
jgi:hypothetical protein